MCRSWTCRRGLCLVPAAQRFQRGIKATLDAGLHAKELRSPRDIQTVSQTWNPWHFNAFGLLYLRL